MSIKNGFKKYFNFSDTSSSENDEVSSPNHCSQDQDIFLSPSYSPHSTSPSHSEDLMQISPPLPGQQSSFASPLKSSSSSPTPGQPPPLRASSPVQQKSADSSKLGAIYNSNHSQASNMDDSMESQLKSLDEDQSLSIWHFLSTFEKDKLVREYVEKIIITGFIPIEPDLDSLTDVDAPEYELPKGVQVNILNNFSTYFQKKNFSKNVQGAVDANHALFKPHDNFKVPHYHQLPLSVFEEVSEAKKRLAINMQNSYLSGVKFSMELLLLQSFVEINEFVKTMFNSEDIVTDHTKYFYITFFAKAKINFLRNFTIKKIDWSKREKESKVKPAYPDWRKKGEKPPVNTKNFYCKDLCTRVVEGKEQISSSSVLREIETNKKKPLEPRTVVTVSQGQDHVSVKKRTKQAKKLAPRKREGNQKYMENRNLGNKVLDFDEAYKNF